MTATKNVGAAHATQPPGAARPGDESVRRGQPPQPLKAARTEPLSIPRATLTPGDEWRASHVGHLQRALDDERRRSAKLAEAVRAALVHPPPRSQLHDDMRAALAAYEARP